MKMAIKNPYKSCLKEMYAFRRFGIKLGLSTIKTILTGLQNPQNSFRSIHVAGTNGKGSIASLLAAILKEAGYTVGLYTSPHLVRFNERICINGTPISDAEVVACYEAVKRVHPGDRDPTFFEYTTAMALYEFGRQKVDWAVIETGMGGRLDATNIISPAITIISNISLEHQSYLGRTIALIAREKGGIIKRNTPVITGATQKNAIAVLKEIAKTRSAPFYRRGDAFRVRKSRPGTFTYWGLKKTWRNLRVNLPGEHQLINAALALAACEILGNGTADIPDEAIRTGLTTNSWPGRLEIVSASPLVILDGAHNRVAAQNLAKYLYANLKNRRITLVVGILDDKPYSAMLKSLLPHCSRVILTRPKIDRGLPPETLFPVAKKIVDDVTILPNVATAVTYAIKTSSPQDAVCIAGSLYVVGEAKETLEAENLPKPLRQP